MDFTLRAAEEYRGLDVKALKGFEEIGKAQLRRLNATQNWVVNRLFMSWMNETYRFCGAEGIQLSLVTCERDWVLQRVMIRLFNAVYLMICFDKSVSTLNTPTLTSSGLNLLQVSTESNSRWSFYRTPSPPPAVLDAARDLGNGLWGAMRGPSIATVTIILVDTQAGF